MATLDDLCPTYSSLFDETMLVQRMVHPEKGEMVIRAYDSMDWHAEDLRAAMRGSDAKMKAELHRLCEPLLRDGYVPVDYWHGIDAEKPPQDPWWISR